MCSSDLGTQKGENFKARGRRPSTAHTARCTQADTQKGRLSQTGPTTYRPRDRWEGNHAAGAPSIGSTCKTLSLVRTPRPTVVPQRGGARRHLTCRRPDRHVSAELFHESLRILGYPRFPYLKMQVWPGRCACRSHIADHRSHTQFLLYTDAHCTQMSV